MRFFKRLELQGFKSFAHKTSIDLLPGVTVIVGPNGCGKSNIFDAIRWVLGETSAKSLRGERMDDVIFSGSGSVKATGMARVGLILDNAQRSLPIDFDEVSIARRLFRTGESEYLLNKAVCRRRDITSLFLDTGIGTDSYSVMEQGKVDAIINSKPIERRYLFDEAAGIAKYKVRKDEALRKLERTDADLGRLAAVIDEVRRAANGLKRQASKAARHRKLSAELETIEMELLVRRHFELLLASASVEAEYAAWRETVERLEQELTALEAQESESRAVADGVQATLESTQSQQFGLEREIADIEGRIALLDQRRETCRARQEDLRREIESIDEEMRRTEERSKQHEDDVAAQRAALDQLRAEFAARKARYDELKSTADDATRRTSSLRHEIVAMGRERLERENEGRIARAMLDKLSEELGRGEAELALLEQQIEALAMERDERQSSLDEATQLLGALRSDLESTASALDSVEKRFATATANLEGARREAQECRSRHDALAEMQANFDGYYRGVREVMLRAREGVLRGIVDVVTSLVQADAAHETAIEVALGSQAQDIVVETAEDADAAIRLLRETKTGRATFLPLDLVEGRRADDALRRAAREPGVVGLACDLVRFEERLRPAVEYLLGNVLVCETLDKAIELRRRGVRGRFVTLAGDLVSAHGAMTGGSVQASTLLHRTREIRELAAQLQTLARCEEELQEETARLREERASLRERYEKLQRLTNAQEVETGRSRSDFAFIEQKLADKTAARDALVGRRVAIESEMERHRASESAATEAVERLSERLAQLEREAASAEEQATSRRREEAEAASEINDLAIQISTDEQRLSNARERLAEVRREQVRLTSVRTARLEDIEQYRQQDEEAASETATLRERLAAYHERRAELGRLITVETQRRDTIQLDLRKLGERVHVVQRDLNEARNSLHEADLRRTEARAQREGLNQQAGERFNKSLDDLVASVFASDRAADSADEAALIEALDEEPADESAETTPGTATPSEATMVRRAGEELTPEAALVALPDRDEAMRRAHELREKIARLGPVNMEAISQYITERDRYEYLAKQQTDLLAAKQQLTDTIAEIDRTTTELFSSAFAEIRSNFREVFRRLFGGGRADLLLTSEDGILDSGIDIVAQPPGKNPQHISLLSGGERALTAIALLFAIFMRKPSPFCILDEIDAPLDDKNIERFKDLVREFTSTTQFIIITHNKQTMALANTIYGITMEEPGVSRVVSLRLDEFEGSQFDREAVLAG
jgi:chromosome segregation protein